MGVLSMMSKFAYFVIATVAFSVFYSLCFFAALCHVCGPNGQFGSVTYMYKSIKDRIKMKSKIGPEG